jgi:protein-S-isoprenylcysteine O-methyltransferase Ste14
MKTSFVRRGGMWVVAQFVLLTIILFGTLFLRATKLEAGWQYPIGLVLSGVGIASIVMGIWLFRRSMYDLGQNLTPYPKPNNKGNLIQTGTYGIVRHPIYSAAILLSLGWSLGINSLVGLVGSVVLLVFFDRKAAREEVWLAEKYADYEQYKNKVKKLIPGIY